MIRGAVVGASLETDGRAPVSLLEQAAPWGDALHGALRGSHAEVLSFSLPPKPDSDRANWTIRIRWVVAQLSPGPSGRRNFRNSFGSTDLGVR